MTESRGRIANLAWLNSRPLAGLLAALDSDGEEARVSGGAVRDALLGDAPGDVDVATTATPQVVLARAADRGWKTAPTGLAHGTVTVIVDGTPFEVTTLRRDVATDGRRAVVAFTRDWAEDAQRRDLTINGLYLDRSGVVHDHVGGLADLKARRVRFIGSACERIREDYLRILRFFRFHARYAEGAPDPDGLLASVRQREGLVSLSRERVRAELLKLLVARRAAETIAEMAQAGLLAPLIGGAYRLARLDRLTRLDARAPDALLRLAALSQFVSEDAERLRSRLRLSNAEAERLEKIGDMIPALSPDGDEAAARRLLYREGAETYRDRVRLAWADAGKEPGDWRWAMLLTLPDRWKAPPLPFSAADLFDRGVPPGPRIGRALRAAERAWIAADFPDGATAVAQVLEFALGEVGEL